MADLTEEHLIEVLHGAGEFDMPPLSLLQLPVELVVVIAGWLALRDVGRLSLSCRTLHTLLAHDSIWHSAAGREYGVPRSLGLPEHHPTWRSLCARLNQCKRVLPSPAVTPGDGDEDEDPTGALTRSSPYRVDDAIHAPITTITFWFMMADVREVDVGRTLPLVMVRSGDKQLCIGLPSRGANLMIATKSLDSDDEVSDSDSDEIFAGPRSSTTKTWELRVETTQAFPVLRWTHVTVEIEGWPSQAQVSSPASKVDHPRPRFAIRFGTEDLGTDLSDQRFNPWEWRRRSRVFVDDCEGTTRKSLIRDVRVYDGRLHQEDIAFLSTIVPPLPDNMEAIEERVMAALRASGDAWPLLGLRYNCAENCNFDICKACYDAGINPTHLPVSPLHELDHGFRVLQTTGYSVRPYLVPPPHRRESAPTATANINNST